MAALAVGVFAGAAVATPVPTGEFEPFGDCPFAVTSTEYCVYGSTEGETLTIGNKTIPLANSIVLQGGYEGSGEEIQFHGAEDGDTLSKPSEPIPGGLLGITPPAGWPAWLKEQFNETINEGFTGVGATVELVGSATSIGLNVENLLSESGTALTLSLKIKLDNPFFGSECYIGSNTEPIMVSLTTGTSGSLHGSAGTVTFNDDFTLVTLSETKLVDATFTVPAAHGCDGIASSLVDPFVDSLFGLPSASGHNHLALKMMIGIAEKTAVEDAIM